MNAFCLIAPLSFAMYVVGYSPYAGIPSFDAHVEYYYLFCAFTAIFGSVAFFSVYFVLWFRVHTVFYSHPLMRMSVSRSALIANYVTAALLFFIIAPGSFFSFAIMWASGMKKVVRQFQTLCVCMWFSLVALAFVFHCMLLFSLTYPLILHRRKMLERGVKVKAVLQTVKKSLMLACTCVFSDLFTSVLFGVFWKLKIDNRFVFLITFPHLFVNVMALQFSFPDWKEKMCFFCCNTKKSKTHQQMSDSRRSTSKLHSNVQSTSLITS